MKNNFVYTLYSLETEQHYLQVAQGVLSL